MIVNSENIEFGYELVSVIPYAYYLHSIGQLERTISGNDTECLYYFSPKHEINKDQRSWYNTPKVKTPNINIHQHTLDLSQFKAPPYKEVYANDKFKFDKETVIICNRYNIEWNAEPINYFDIPTLRKLFELLKDYQVIYINIEGRKELYDNAPPMQLNEWSMLKEYDNVINIHDLHKKNKDLSFNTLQLMLFANCSKFITMNGGYALLSTFFGGENIIMSKLGLPQAKELHPNINSFYRWYHVFGGQRVLHVKDENNLINKVKKLWVEKEPLINILVRTSGRERYFKECIKSILEQEYDNYRIIVSNDNNDKYIIKYPVYPVYIKQEQIEKVKKDYSKDGIVFPYNDYINTMQKHVDSGLIMYLDDDDRLNDKKTFKKIAEQYNKGDELILWRVKIGQKTFPPSDLFGQEPKLFNISGIGFAFDSKYKEFAYWRPFKRADFHCVDSLYKNITNKSWINEVLAVTQNGSHAGMRIDKPVIKNNEMRRNFIEVRFLKDFNGRKKGDIEKMSETKAVSFRLKGIVIEASIPEKNEPVKQEIKEEAIQLTPKKKPGRKPKK